MGDYIPITDSERSQMLAEIGLDSIGRLFDDIPEEVRLKDRLNIPQGLSELETRERLTEIAGENTVFPSIFRGAGAYNHYIPSIVKYVPAKEEFLTAYTPYQAEMSQGVLQSIFEYQSMICELTGMDASNASVYDGATAAAEAVSMCRERNRSKAVMFDNVHPDVIQTVQTYCNAMGVKLCVLKSQNGRTDIEALKSAMDSEAMCFMLQQPNYFGVLEDENALKQIEQTVHGAGAKYIISANPMSLAILKTPAELGADIAVGDAQPFGLPLSFGGPYIGFIACTAKLMRQLPGRIVGETTDINDKRAFVLTLQAREQHIRREKASSSICSNQALCALTVAVYLSAMGKEGLIDTTNQCYSKAKYAAEKIGGLKGFGLLYGGEFFNEFVTDCAYDVDMVMNKLADNGILGGYPLDGEHKGKILWCVTEMNKKADIDKLADILKEVASA